MIVSDLLFLNVSVAILKQKWEETISEGKIRKHNIFLGVYFRKYQALYSLIQQFLCPCSHPSPQPFGSKQACFAGHMCMGNVMTASKHQCVRDKYVSSYEAVSSIKEANGVSWQFRG